MIKERSKNELVKGLKSDQQTTLANVQQVFENGDTLDVFRIIFRNGKFRSFHWKMIETYEEFKAVFSLYLKENNLLLCNS